MAGSPSILEDRLFSKQSCRVLVVLIPLTGQGAISFAQGVAPAPEAVASATDARALTIEAALQEAAERNPEISLAAADLQAAEGQLVGANTYSYNPEVGGSAGRAAGDDGNVTDYQLSVGQTLELGGKRGKRTDSARARRDAAALRLEFARKSVNADVRRAHLLVLVARDRVEAISEAEQVALSVNDTAVERLREGVGTQLELNLAAAGLARTRGDRVAADRRLREARTQLAAVTGAVGEVDAEGLLVAPPILPLTQSDYVARAVARPDVAAFAQETRAAQVDVALARALGVPDITLGGTYERKDRALLFGVTVPLPLFNRNQGGRAVAAAALSRAGISEKTARLEAERAARSAYLSYEGARRALASFDRGVVDRLAENLDLARESQRAGKIGLAELNLVRRDLVDARLAYLESFAEIAEARRALETATGTELQ